jgi:hypothetical protein
METAPVHLPRSEKLVYFHIGLLQETRSHGNDSVISSIFSGPASFLIDVPLADEFRICFSDSGSMDNSLTFNGLLSAYAAQVLTAVG